MRGRVRRNQWIEGVIYNGSNILLMEERRKPYAKPDKPMKPRITVFICDGNHLRVGEIREDTFVGRCVLEHDPMMRWGNYDRFFHDETVRVITVYLKSNNDGLEAISKELLRYIASADIEGKILLIGHSKGGIFLYKVGKKLAESNDKNNVAVITVSAPFGGTVMASNKQFEKSPKLCFPKMMNWLHKKICSEHQDDLDVEVDSKFLKSIRPLPDYVNHIAFVSLISSKHSCQSIRDHLLKVVNHWCLIRGDGVVSCASQEKWPAFSIPDMCFVISATHANAMKRVLSAVAQYAGGEFFFSELEAFRESPTAKEFARL